MPAQLLTGRLLLYVCGLLQIIGQVRAEYEGGTPCDLASCKCAGIDLGSFAKREYLTTDTAGFKYIITMCGVIDPGSVPSGCAGKANQPSVLKVEQSTDALCSQIGSVGPCSSGATCGMTGEVKDNALLVNFQYFYGNTKSIVTLTLTKGDEPTPGKISSNTAPGAGGVSTYSASWPCLKTAPASGFLGLGDYLPSLPLLVVCALVVLGLPLYCGVGMFLNSSRTGVSEIPHGEFWRSLPGLVGDGVGFTLRLGGGRNGRGGGGGAGFRAGATGQRASLVTPFAKATDGDGLDAGRRERRGSKASSSGGSTNEKAGKKGKSGSKKEKQSKEERRRRKSEPDRPDSGERSRRSSKSKLALEDKHKSSRRQSEGTVGGKERKKHSK